MKISKKTVRTQRSGSVLVLVPLALLCATVPGHANAATPSVLPAFQATVSQAPHTGVLAAEYFVAVDGNDANSCTEARSPGMSKRSMHSAWGCMQPGDTMTVGDGTYSDASPPSDFGGTNTAKIIVRARRDGGALLSGGVNLRGAHHIQFEGFDVTGGGSAVAAVSNGPGQVTHHVTFRRTGFTCTWPGSRINDGACVSISDGAHHMLFEDFWVSGSGRYSVMAYGGPGGHPANVTADYNTFRRGVIRQGPTRSSGGNPQSGISLYYASHNTIENVIVLDSVPKSDSSNSAFYVTAHTPPPNASGNKFYGVVALNNFGTGFYLDADNGAKVNNTLISNSVFWGSPQDGISFYINGECNWTHVEHVTSGANGGNGLWNYCDQTRVQSSLFVDNHGLGLSQGGSGSISPNFNNYFGNLRGSLNVDAGEHDIEGDPQLAYLLRLESIGACKGAGKGGSDCGAVVVNRYQDGVLTTEPLWPWPNEDRIKASMCGGSNSTRGFCAKESLTEYVWTYLGNSNPF